MEYFEVAAKWWVDQNRKSELSKFHNNEIAPNSGTILLYEATTRHSIHPTEEDFTKFYDLLSNYIKDVVEEDRLLACSHTGCLLWGLGAADRKRFPL